MAFQTSSYNTLPEEMQLYILKFLDLETLISIIQYLDNKHRLFVIDILKKYTLTKSDCDSPWFDFIKTQNTQFLHRYLKPQDTYIMIHSNITGQKTQSWREYIKHTIKFSIIHNNPVLYYYLLTKYFTCDYKNIRNHITSNSPKWYLSLITSSFISTILYAIEHNSLLIIKMILSLKDINFRFNKHDPEEIAFAIKLFYNFAKTAILHNKVDILNYFTLKCTYTNEQYNDLLVVCVNNTLIDTAIRENKPHVLYYIISKLTNSSPSVPSVPSVPSSPCTCVSSAPSAPSIPSSPCTCVPSSPCACDSSKNDTPIYQLQLLDTHIAKCFEELSNNEAKHNIITYFITKFGHKITIERFRILICVQINIINNTINNDSIIKNIDIVKQLMTLYLNSNVSLHELPLFTPDEVHNNLMHVISHIKQSLTYECFKRSLVGNFKIELVLFLQDILYRICIKYNITKEIIVKYIFLDYIKFSIQTDHNEINTKNLYSTLIKGLPSIYDIDNIKNIMNTFSVKYNSIECYTYFHNLFIQKSVLTKPLYIELLKHNLYLAIQNTHNIWHYNLILPFILLKLKEIGVQNSFQDDKYIPLFINFIKSKNNDIILIMCNNGFTISGNNEYLQVALKTKCISLIKQLINCGLIIASNEYSVIHYALKQKTTKLAIFIKDKLVADNKLQEYLDWETNPDYRLKFLNF